MLKKLLNKSISNTNSEASFIDHLEALRWHIVRSLIAIIIFSVVAFIYITPIFDKIILRPPPIQILSPTDYFANCGKLLHIDNLCINNVAIDFQNTQLSGQFIMSLTSAMVFGFRQWLSHMWLTKFGNLLNLPHRKRKKNEHRIYFLG